MSTTPHRVPATRAEFDALAETYHEQHRANVAITGEEPEYFAAYKVADLARCAARLPIPAGRILDFGSGIGNAVPHFRRHFPYSLVCCADVSEESMALARRRFPGRERYLSVAGDIALPTGSQDIVFSACTFHHIPHGEHLHWLAELRRVTRPGGLLAIYEHNPLNPLTVHAVRTCPLDVGAHLIGARALRQRAEQAGWSQAAVAYKLFFPAPLRGLRPLEPRLEWLPAGAQYRLSARA